MPEQPVSNRLFLLHIFRSRRIIFGKESEDCEMKVIVVSKRTWIALLIALALLAIVLIVVLTSQGENPETAAPTMTVVDAYELNAIPVTSRLVPVYRVS